jgi:excisionase family DNA binding protein
VARSNAELASAEVLVLTIEEAAKLLRLSTDSAYEAARRGEIPTLRIGPAFSCLSGLCLI